MIYKMLFLSLPQGSGHDRKKVLEHGFLTSEFDTH